MLLTHVWTGSPGTFFITLVQIFPPSFVTCRFPSSVPAQINFLFRGDSQIEKIVQWFSAAELSIDKPPDSSCFSLSGSFVVRSLEILTQVSPRLVVLYKYCAPIYM